MRRVATDAPDMRSSRPRDGSVASSPHRGTMSAQEPGSQIPDRLLFVWSGPSLPYYARLAIESALLAEPDCSVEVHLVDRDTEGRHLDRVARYRRVSIHHVDVDELLATVDPCPGSLGALYRRIPTGRASARANLIRYALLHRRGGVYLDTDTLVLRTMAPLRAGPDFVGAERVWQVDGPRLEGAREPWMILPTLAFAAAYAARRAAALARRPANPCEPLGAAHRLWSRLQPNNAVIGARPESRMTEALLRAAISADPATRYSLGPTLVDDVVSRSSVDVVVLPPDAFYCVPPSHSFRFFHGPPFAPPAASYLVHVVHSNHRRELGRLSPELLERRRRGPTYYRLASDVAGRAASLPRRLAVA